MCTVTSGPPWLPKEALVLLLTTVLSCVLQRRVCLAEHTLSSEAAWDWGTAVSWEMLGPSSILSSLCSPGKLVGLLSVSSSSLNCDREAEVRTGRLDLGSRILYSFWNLSFYRNGVQIEVLEQETEGFEFRVFEL